MRGHLKLHNKKYRCLHCDQRFTWPSLLRKHNQEDHPHLPVRYTIHKKPSDKLLVRNPDGDYKPMSGTYKPTTVSSTQPTRYKRPRQDNALPDAKRMTARKSTGPIQFTAPYSYYGNKPDMDGVESVTVVLAQDDVLTRVSFEQLRKMMHIDAVIEVDDCMADVTRENEAQLL